MSEFKFKQFSIRQEGAPFKVGTDSMILGSWAELNGSESVLDIGTGTGILALMLAQKLDSGTVLACEPDRKAFEIAEQNFKNSPFSDKLIPINEPLQNLKPTSKLDIIISNPPYFSDSTLSKELTVSARHTVDLGFKEIAEFCAEYLADSGTFYIVLPSKEYEVFKDEMQNAKIFESKRLEISSFSHAKVKRVCAAFSREETGVQVEQLFIRNSEDNSYSRDYQELVKDYQIRF